MRGASRTALLLLVFAGPALAGEQALLELSADVTAVESRAGLLRALGWPLVVGDRLEGTLSIGADGRAELAISCGRVAWRHGPFPLERGPEAAALRFEAGPRTLPHPDGPVAVVTTLDDGMLVLRLARAGTEAGPGAPADRVEARVVALHRAPPAHAPGWPVVLLVAGAALLACAAGVAAWRRRRRIRLAEGPRALR